jgi:hypothetical protein
VSGTDPSTKNPACPIHLVYRRAVGDGRAGQRIGARQANRCQALIPLSHSVAVACSDAVSRLYDGHLVRRSLVVSEFGRAERVPTSSPKRVGSQRVNVIGDGIGDRRSTDFRQARDGQDVRRTRSVSRRSGTAIVASCLVRRTFCPSPLAAYTLRDTKPREAPATRRRR